MFRPKCVPHPCGPRVDPKGPGALPEIQEGLAPAPVPRVAPRPPAAAPAPVAADDEPPLPADAPPPRALVTLAPAKGSKVSGQLSLVQGEEGTALVGTISGLARNTSYALGKRDHCGVFKADDDSRRSNPLVYGIAIKSDGNGVANVSDSAKIVHLDGPMSLMGAFFVISKNASSSELACGRVVAAS